MALTATIHNLNIDLADVDRGVYEKLTLRMARQPSETLEYMLMRVFAYCLEYGKASSLPRVSRLVMNLQCLFEIRQERLRPDRSGNASIPAVCTAG
jgi:hypothetical protein